MGHVRSGIRPSIIPGLAAVRLHVGVLDQDQPPGVHRWALGALGPDGDVPGASRFARPDLGGMRQCETGRYARPGQDGCGEADLVETVIQYLGRAGKGDAASLPMCQQR